MDLYRYRPDADHFNGIGLHDEDREQVSDLHYSARRVGGSWKPLPVKLFDDCGVDGDFPSLSDCWHIPVMSERAWRALSPLIGARSEALPIVHPRGSYFIINVLDMIDCLDKRRSEVTRSQIDGRISRIWHYVVLAELIPPEVHMFKIPLDSGADLLVDKHFRLVVENNGLAGLLFKPLP